MLKYQSKEGLDDKKVYENSVPPSNNIEKSMEDILIPSAETHKKLKNLTIHRRWPIYQL